ncbi:MAG: DUF6088 family protein [Gammaproteobacteria bacterium]
MLESVFHNVKNRIFEHGRGWCFTPKHFLDLNSDTGVRSALSRLEKGKIIRRLAQGLYEYPRQHKLLGILPPKVDIVAKAISEKNGTQIQPSGAYATNLLGFSEQVPGRIVFLTNGPSKKIKIGKQEILFRTTAEKNMYPAGTNVGLVIQAFRHLGKENINSIVQVRTKEILSKIPEDQIINDLKYASQWIRVFIFKIMDIKI